MPWYLKYIMSADRRLMDKANDDNGGGGGGADDDDKNDDDDSGNDLAELKAQNAKLMERIEKLEASGRKSEEDDDDLNTKAKRDREAKEKNSNDAKALEKAIEFNYGVKDWIEKNKSLLPKDISDLYDTHSKEKYDSAVDKDRALKAGIVKSFFEQQANLDLLTSAQKNQLEDYLKLTNTGRQEKAQHIYDMVFEPAFEMLKRTKKAEALRQGHGDGSDDGYKERLMGLSKQHYLGEKKQ